MIARLGCGKIEIALEADRVHRTEILTLPRQSALSCRGAVRVAVEPADETDNEVHETRTAVRGAWKVPDLQSTLVQQEFDVIDGIVVAVKDDDRFEMAPVDCRQKRPEVLGHGQRAVSGNAEIDDGERPMQRRESLIQI